jgi:hypothetical protein
MRDATPAVRTATAERSLTPERDYAGVFNLGLYRRHRARPSPKRWRARVWSSCGTHRPSRFPPRSSGELLAEVERARTFVRRRQVVEVTAAKRMIERRSTRFDLYSARLAGDSAYGSAEMLSWLVYQHGIEPPSPRTCPEHQWPPLGDRSPDDALPGLPREPAGQEARLQSVLGWIKTSPSGQSRTKLPGWRGVQLGSSGKACNSATDRYKSMSLRTCATMSCSASIFARARRASDTQISGVIRR